MLFGLHVRDIKASGSVVMEPPVAAIGIFVPDSDAAIGLVTSI